MTVGDLAVYAAFGLVVVWLGVVVIGGLYLFAKYVAKAFPPDPS